MKRPELLPSETQRMIPSEVEKGIYPRFYKGKDGAVSLVWWVRVWKDRKPISQSSQSSRYSDAVALKRKLIAEIETGQRAGGAVDQVRVADVLAHYIAEADLSERSKHDYRNTAENLINPIIGKVRVSKLTTEKLKEFRDRRVAAIVARKAKTADRVEAVKKAANTSVNRNLALLHAALLHGQRRTPRTVMAIPFIPRTSEKDNARQGFLETAKYEALRDAFNDPAVRLLFIVGYNVGCRSGELRQFEWSMVDFEDCLIRLPGRITKNGKPRSVPIFAGDMLNALKTAKQEHDEFYSDSPWVFSRAGRPVKNFRKEWEKATTAAAVPELLFHDLRRTAVRNMVRLHGLDRTVAKKISGHLTDSMFERYSIVDEHDIKAAKAKVDGAKQTPPEPAVNQDLLAVLASVPEEKLRALVALLK